MPRNTKRASVVRSLRLGYDQHRLFDAFMLFSGARDRYSALQLLESVIDELTISDFRTPTFKPTAITVTFPVEVFNALSRKGDEFGIPDIRILFRAIEKWLASISDTGHYQI